MAFSKATRAEVPQLNYPKWLSLNEAAKYLGIGTKFLKSRCRSREITFIRVGRRGRSRTGQYKFQVHWLDQYIERIAIHALPPPDRKRVRPQPLVTGPIFIDPNKCGNPFE